MAVIRQKAGCIQEKASQGSQMKFPIEIWLGIDDLLARYHIYGKVARCRESDELYFIHEQQHRRFKLIRYGDAVAAHLVRKGSETLH